MPLPSPLRRAALLAFALCPFAAAVAAPARVVDFRYGIATWHQPLGVPGDWHKPLANERGALLYDFGPGPYVQPRTTVEFTAAGEPFTVASQSWLDTARAPFLRSRLTRGTAGIELTTLALPPAAAAPSDSRTAAYERLDGIAGALDWANPGENASPEFRNVAWGVNRPIHYRVRVAPGAAKRVMLGFCESYKLKLDQRLADMHVEGAPAQLVDLALNAPLNRPQIFLFDAVDTDRDGRIDVRIVAPQGRDPNTTLATIAVYPAGLTLTRAELVAGSTESPDRAELRIACGGEVRRLPSRTDLLHAVYTGAVQPVLAVKTGRRLALGADGVVTESGVPFIATAPAPAALERTEAGWQLTFPADTKTATAWIFSGQTSDAEVAAARRVAAPAAIAAARERWAGQAVPYSSITVADPAIQRLVDASVRTLYQARETINGHTQFNSSFSLYRGLWAGDAVYFANLAAQFGDSAGARATLDALFSHQRPDGIIDELHPQQIFRATAEVLWCVAREAQITGDLDYARTHWPQILRGVAGLRALREKTLATPAAPYAGLFPPGFSDGGIMDIGAEYSSVYCAITGLNATARLARALGHESDRAAIQELSDAFLGSFNRHRARDQRRDAAGHLYLPVRVGFTGPDPIPQLTQWAFMDAHLNGEGWLPSDHELVTGPLALLESVEQQGLPVSLGWMPGGNWAGMGLFYGLQFLITGRAEKTADVLYAAANHASPLGTWVEEQSLVGQPPKLAGDQPHCFASAMFAQLVGSMLAYDRLDTLHLLGAVPPEWLRAGAVNRLDRWHTGAGTVTLALTVAADGRSAAVRVETVGRAGKDSRILLHLASLARAGFAVPADTLPLAPGEPFVLNLTRSPP